MATVDVETGYSGYREIVHLVRRTGIKRAPRGKTTLDAGLTVIRVRSPYSALPVGQGRRLNVAIGAAEAIQLVGAFSDPEMLVSVSPSFAQFRRADGSFHGAYGRRVGSQVLHAVRKLRTDPETRQAVVTLWDPVLDNLVGEADYPCTLGFNFALTDDGLLTMNVIMRSSDVWLGLPYDLFQFTQLQLTVARALSLLPGPFTLTTWSLHMYESDIERSYALTEHPTASPLVVPEGFGRPGDNWERCRERAQRLRFMGLVARDRGFFSSLTSSERWYRDTLAPFVG